MALRDMIGSLMGRIPKLSSQLARTLINDSLAKIYDENTWSFNLFEAGWLTPSLVQAGTITTQVGYDTVVGDPTAVAAWNAIALILVRMQIRLPAYALYSVIAYDGVSTLTLDRPWMEPAGTGQHYMMYQAYYAPPMQDFKNWITIRDTTNAADVNFWDFKESDLAARDPQRSIFEQPWCAVPYKTDTRGAGTLNASPTLGYMLWELYPHPLSQLPYALYGARTGKPLVLPTDTLPYPLTEACVLDRARALAYEWKESQKGQETHRGSGADYKFLMGVAEALYKERIQDIRKSDRDLVDNFVTKIRRGLGGRIGAPFYSPITGRATVGSY